MHYMGGTSGTIKGLLYRGDAKTKYSVKNNPTIPHYTRVDPNELALIVKFNNRDEASQFMLKQVDFDDNARQILPNSPNVEELTTF